MRSSFYFKDDEICLSFAAMLFSNGFISVVSLLRGILCVQINANLKEKMVALFRFFWDAFCLEKGH